MRSITSYAIYRLGLVKEQKRIQDENNNIGQSLETRDGKYENMTDLELFNEALIVDRGNLIALRKLADIEFLNKNFLAAALCYEKYMTKLRLMNATKERIVKNKHQLSLMSSLETILSEHALKIPCLLTKATRQLNLIFASKDKRIRRKLQESS